LRKIVHQTTRHKELPRLASLILLATTTLVMTGCGDRSQQSSQKTDRASDNVSSVDCPVEINIATWAVFADIADRLAAGQTVPRAEIDAYSILPVVTKWRGSQAPHAPQAKNLANWIEAAWWEEQGHTGRQKLSTNRVVLGRLYRYSQEHRAEIDAMLDEFQSTGLACQAYDQAVSWIDPALIPNPLIINFVPSAAEVRIFEGEVFIDTSVLRAGGPHQVSRQITALLYRKFGTLAGTNPRETTGAASVAECMRLFMNEGIAGTVESTLTIEFDSEHPSLYKIHIIPDDFFRKTQETVANLNKWLAPLIDDDEAMASGGIEVARALIGNNAFGQTGLGMTAVITGRLGEERLHQVNGSVPMFLAAFQEAALLNADPVPDPGLLGIEYFESVPPFQPAVYQGLQALVDEYFSND